MMLVHAKNREPITKVDLAIAFTSAVGRACTLPGAAAPQTPARNGRPTESGIRQVTTRGKGIRKVRYHGIEKAARDLKVTRSHLYRVIQGERRSPRLEAYLNEHMRRAS